MRRTHARTTVIEQPFEAAVFRRSAIGGTAEQLHPTRESAASNEHSRLRAMMYVLRELLSEQNVSESEDADEEGYYFVVEGGREVSVHYHSAEDHRSTCASALRPIGLALLKCCGEMARRGYTTTLFMSPRAIALHVSD